MLRPRRVHLLPPVSYQGGKRRQAPEIVRHMNLDPEQEFWELCAGSGAVSLELISRGHNPAKITMVDAGPWGDVWRLVGAGEFDLQVFEELCGEVPAAKQAVADYLVHLSETVLPQHDRAPYVFLLLQAGSFGGKPVGEKDGKWKHFSFRRTFRRPSADTAMTPPPHILVPRIRRICQRAKGMRGERMDASRVEPRSGAVVYLDPDYKGTSGYLHTLDPLALARQWPESPVFVSEAIPLCPASRVLRERRGGTVNAVSDKRDRSEYLSLFNADWPTPDYERAEQMSVFDA